jgi:hypothetical protein
VLAIALANKLARIAWSVLAHGRAFEANKPQVLDGDVAPLDETFLPQASAKLRHKTRERRGRRAAEQPDNRHLRLLRPRRDWPRLPPRRRAA